MLALNKRLGSVPGEGIRPMNSVTALELAAKIVQLLGINAGESIDLAKLRDGSVLLRKAEAPGAQP